MLRVASNFPTAYVRVASQTYVLQHIYDQVTSSPSVHSLALSRPPSASSNMTPSAVSATPLTEVSTKPEKRRSYLEAVSSTNLAVLEDVATPRQAKSADPLWLPAGKPIQL